MPLRATDNDAGIVATVPKVIKKGNSGDIHDFEHESGQVADVKFFPIPTDRKTDMRLETILSATGENRAEELKISLASSWG